MVNYNEVVLKVAICFSGELRSLDSTHQNLKNFIENSFEDYTIFAHIPFNHNSHTFKNYFPNSIINIEKDKRFLISRISKSQVYSVKNKYNQDLSKARRSYLLQLYGIYKSNYIKTQYENLNSMKFDWVIRCRTDLKFYTPKIELNLFDNNFIFTPNFHQFEGINDRFFLGSSENMDTLSKLYKYVRFNKVQGFNAESILKNYINSNNIEIKHFDIKFNRVRNNKTELKDF